MPNTSTAPASQGFPHALADAAHVYPLPGRGAFGTRDEHRRWYRQHLWDLVNRCDLTVTEIAEAAEVSNTCIKKWFLSDHDLGMTPQQYRTSIKMTKQIKTPQVPAATQASIVRIHYGVGCFDSVDANVVVDLRETRRVLSLPVHQVLMSAPTGATKQWDRDVATARRPWSTWVLKGYGLGTNKATATSVLMATSIPATSEPTGPTDSTDGTGGAEGPEQPWRMVVLTDGRSHGKFSLTWVTQVLPAIADALTHSPGAVKDAGGHRYAEVQRLAHQTLDDLADVLDDPEPWVGVTSHHQPLAGWDYQHGHWSDSVSNLTFLLGWAAVGLPRLALAATFEAQGWGPSEAFVLEHYLGVDDFEAMARALHGAGRVSLNHVRQMVCDAEDASQG